MEGKIKSFQDRQKLKEYVTTKLALQEILRKTLKKRGSTRNNPQKQGLNRYHDDTKFISFNSNSERDRLNDLIKKCRVSDWIKKQDYQYTV